LGAGIERQSGVADIGLLADVQIAHGRFDINVLLAILGIVVRMDATGGRTQRAANNPPRESIAITLRLNISRLNMGGTS